MTEVHHLDEGIPTAQNKDGGKPALGLLPWVGLVEVGRVMEFGARKYAKHNWAQAGGMDWTRQLSSCLRHIAAWAMGESVDTESGLPHLAHAVTRLLYLLYYERYGIGTDDRLKGAGHV